MDLCLREGEQPTLNDRIVMPRLEAAIAEVQRIRSVTPLGIPHGTSEVFIPNEQARWKYNLYNYTNCIICCMIVQDVEIGGYDIPCGAMIVPMQWAIHTDPAYWRDPLEFRPDRFLSEDGTFFKPESFLPFQNGKNGTFCSLFLKHSSLHLSYFKGKRVCVGEELARMILFLFAGRILRAFSVRVPAGEIADLEGECGITLVPKPHRLAFVGRDRWDFFFFYFFLLFLYEREKFHFEKIKYLLKIYSAGRTIRPFRKFSSNGRDGFRFSIRSPLHVFPLCCRGRFFSFSLFFYVFLSSERIVLYLPAAPPFIPISAHILHFSL